MQVTYPLSWEKPAEWINPTEVLGEQATELGQIESNGYTVMVLVRRLLQRAGNNKTVRDAYVQEAVKDDYQHLLAVSMDYLGRMFYSKS